LAKEVNNDIRALEKMHAGAEAQAKLAEINAKIEKIRSLNPRFVQLRMLESKYRRLEGMFGQKQQAETKPVVDSAAKEAALKDWEAIIALKKDFVDDLETVIPTYVQNIIYTEDNADPVIAKIYQLKARAPEVKAKVQAFSQKYGTDKDAIDKKMQELTPKDPSKGMYDEVNQRPSQSAGHCFTELVNGLTNLEEAPKIEAKHILTRALQFLEGVDSITDTARDRRYAQVEEKIQLGLKFNPNDSELKEWAVKIKQLRQKSQQDVAKALEEARFPGHYTNFAGPGNVNQLAESCIKYFNNEDPSQTTVRVSVAGNWVVAKRNIFDQPIQWGLPIWAVGYKNDNKEIARVFKLTILTEEGLNVKKAPPWTGVWVGDSYRMKSSNINK
ncbi:hypothetical protein JW935_22980, partial [candidate division KSB1 bacterium]|nr:hypothetical protein [candidate division KSB1 bacterium]